MFFFLSRSLLTSAKISGLGDFLINNTGWFNSSAFKMLWIQLLCLVLTIIQLYLMDVVLGNQFLHLGMHIFNSQELSVALYDVFPIGEVRSSSPEFKSYY